MSKMEMTPKICKELHEGEYDETTKKCYVKKVFSFDFGSMMDRTKQSHPYGSFDIDFRKLDAPNKEARNWTYGGTARSLLKARTDALNIQTMKDNVQVRIVDSKTGELLEYH